jgi:hypothetical protein
MAISSSGSPISKATTLYATLRYLAGGSFYDICFAWDIGKSTFFASDYHGVLWPTIDAIDKALFIGLPVNDKETLERMAEEFSTFSHGHGELRGCVTAIDGWVAETRKRKISEVRDIMAYRNRHNCWD